MKKFGTVHQADKLPFNWQFKNGGGGAFGQMFSFHVVRANLSSATVLFRQKRVRE